MTDVTRSAQTIGTFLQNFIAGSGLRLRFRVKLRAAKALGEHEPELTDSEPIEESGGTEGARTLFVEFSGPDTSLLTTRNGELLNALEHVAAKMLRLEPESHDQVSFDADHFKADRDRRLRESAATAIEQVKASGRPHPFPAMSSRERRMLHMILSESGLPTASSGEGPARFVVLYPAGADTSASDYGSQQAPRRRDANHIREAFRHR